LHFAVLLVFSVDRAFHLRQLLASLLTTRKVFVLCPKIIPYFVLGWTWLHWIIYCSNRETNVVVWKITQICVWLHQWCCTSSHQDNHQHINAMRQHTKKPTQSTTHRHGHSQQHTSKHRHINTSTHLHNHQHKSSTRQYHQLNHYSQCVNASTQTHHKSSKCVDV
jgi:hypothetical protein